MGRHHVLKLLNKLPQTCSNPAKRRLIYLLSTSDWQDLIPSKSPGASSEGMVFLDLHRLKCAEAHRVGAGRAVEVTSSQHRLCVPVLFARPLLPQFSYVAEVGMAAPPAKGSRWSRPGQAEDDGPRDGFSGGRTARARREAQLHGLLEATEKEHLFQTDLDLLGGEPGISGGCRAITGQNMLQKEADAKVSRNRRWRNSKPVSLTWAESSRSCGQTHLWRSTTASFFVNHLLFYVLLKF